MHRFILLTFFLVTAVMSYADDCHPEVKDKAYIVGYGSLLDEDSLRSTIGDVPPFASALAKVKGFTRHFNLFYEVFGLKSAALLATPKENSVINALLFELDSASIYKLDEREKGYCRRPVSKNNVVFYNEIDAFNDKDVAYIYLLKDKLPIVVGKLTDQANDSQSIEEVTQQPTAIDPSEYMVSQVYIDLFLGGCIKLEQKFKTENFAKDCVLTTEGWTEMSVVNDRLVPRRPWQYQPLAMKIDGLLASFAPGMIEKRKLES
ncbi:MAG: gamma-glutamylcyclotransferase family protein [Pseudomonadota bacterium]|nr:gamma-glutamylcyclotransferase family protein [Pseudomonadota bacterium]